MAQLLSPRNEEYLPAHLVIAAVKGEDVDIVQWALNKSDPRELSKLTQVMLHTNLDSIYRLWEEHLVQIPQSESSRQGPQNQFEVLFKQSVFRQVVGDAAREERLTHTWDVLIKSDKLGDDTMSAALVSLAKSTCSKPLAEFLIDHGADLDYPKSPSGHTKSSGKTALRIAADKLSDEAAHFMECLLDRGAHPFQSKSGSNTFTSFEDIGERPGAKQIFSMVGSTWEQIVERNTEKRKYKDSFAMACHATMARVQDKLMKRAEKRQQRDKERQKVATRRMKSALKHAKKQKRRRRGVQKHISGTTKAQKNRQ